MNVNLVPDFDESFESTAHVAGDESPVTVWLRRLEAGDADAAQPLYQHFCTRLHALARRRIPANIRTVYDHDDAAASAFNSLFLCLKAGRYQLQDRTDIWRLLLTIAERKIAHRIRDELCDKRDIRRVVQNSVFVRTTLAEPDKTRPEVESLVQREPTPEFAAEVSDTCDALLAALPDDDSRQIALLRLEGYTSEEIATKLSRSRRTIHRKLRVIRITWRDAAKLVINNFDVSQSGDE